MLMALSDREQDLVLATKELDKEAAYSCPSCQSRVHLKIGKVIRPHFAHYQHSACEVFSEGETAEHIEGKLQLAKWFETLNLKVEVEAYLPELKQRPDLLVTTNQQKIAIEFQCSAIPIEKVVERTEGYQKAGYQVVWLLGEQFIYGRKLTGFQQACLTNFKNQLVLFHYFTETQRLEYRTNFQLKQTRKMSCTKRLLRWGQPLRFHVEKTKPPSQKINYELEHQKLSRQCQRPSPKLKQFLELLYQNEESIISMPKELYAVAPSEWVIKDQSQEWKFRFILWLESFPLDTIITRRMLENYAQTVKFHDISQLTSPQKLRPFYEIIQILVKTGTLKQVRLNKWAIARYPERFQHLEEKFHQMIF
jgi:competence protein CoiA